jgi:tetratricopeptide (TPR) repeat protein
MLRCPRLSALLLAAALAAAADGPTDAEWAPAAKAIADNAPDAIAQVEAVSARFPQWADGHRTLATLRLRAGDNPGAWKAALAALRISKTDAQAAALGIPALAGQGRFPDAFKVADNFADGSDPGGAVAAAAAVAALQAGDETRLSDYLAKAKARAGDKPDATLDFIAAKLAQRKADLAGAAAALEKAIAARKDYRDALYELGRVRLVQGLGAKEGQADLFAKAEEAFQRAARLDQRDADSRFGLGRARLERGKALAAAGQKDEAGAAWRQVIPALDEALQIQPTERDAKLWKGDALLRLERYEEAAPLLRQALDGGATDRALPFNLSLALSKSGRGAEAAEVLKDVRAANVDELLTIAINAFEQGNWAAAQKLFLDSLRELPIDTPERATQRWAACRYIAHCAREQAALETDPAKREELIETAVRFYQEAGDNRDFASRHWYMHLQVPRSPMHAFVAGRKSLEWDGMWNPTAWKLLVANYGHKVSRGQGFAGAFQYSKAHVMLWALLTFIPIGLFLKGWLLPGGLYGQAKPATKTAKRPSAGAPPSATSRSTPGPRPATGRMAKPGSAVARKPGTGATRKPGQPPAGGAKTPFSE